MFYSRWAAEGCPHKALHADGSVGEQRCLAAVTTVVLPREETEYIQHLAAAVALQSKAPWLSRMETGPLSNLMVLLELGMSL